MEMQEDQLFDEKRFNVWLLDSIRYTEREIVFHRIERTYKHIDKRRRIRITYNGAAYRNMWRVHIRKFHRSKGVSIHKMFSVEVKDIDRYVWDNLIRKRYREKGI